MFWITFSNVLNKEKNEDVFRKVIENLKVERLRKLPTIQLPVFISSGNWKIKINYKQGSLDQQTDFPRWMQAHSSALKHSINYATP